MRILFVGCVESSYVLLQSLLEHKKEIVGVITKKEAGLNADYKDLSVLCLNYGIDYKYISNINDEEVIRYVREKNADIIYCFGWSQIIKKELLEITPMGVIGFHPAALPNNRGRHPIIWALALGLNETASTFFKMDEGADTGDIVSQVKIPICESDYAADLYENIMCAAKKQVLEFTENLENGSCRTISQKKQEGNTWRKRGRKDGIIDWRMGSSAIYNLIRALSHPYIGAEFEYKEKYYKVWKSEIVKSDGKYQNIEPGRIIKKVSDHEFYVKSYDDIIHILECDTIDALEGEYL